MDDTTFYARCARLLGTEHDVSEPKRFSEHVRYDGTIRNTPKTRWNGREPGSGRFPGHGLIRSFGTVVHVNLRTPHMSGIYTTREEALAAIARTLGVQADEETS
jgi:hypothetical protein